MASYRREPKNTEFRVRLMCISDAFADIEAEATLRMLEEMDTVYTDELRALKRSDIH